MLPAASEPKSLAGTIPRERRKGVDRGVEKVAAAKVAVVVGSIVRAAANKAEHDPAEIAALVRRAALVKADKVAADVDSAASLKAAAAAVSIAVLRSTKKGHRSRPSSRRSRSHRLRLQRN